MRTIRMPACWATTGSVSRPALPAVALILAALAGCTAPDEAPPPPQVWTEYTPQAGLLRIGPEPGRAVPLVEKGYTLILPDSTVPPAGLVVFLDGRRADFSAAVVTPGAFEYEALARGVGILHLTTGNPLDFLFSDAEVAAVAERLQALVVAYGLRDVPVFYAGLSLGGTRALRLAIFQVQHGTAYGPPPAAVAVVDAPLDMERFWAAEVRAAAADFHPAAADEGRWVRYLLETHLGGPPTTHRDRYVAYSPYTHTAPGGGNAVHLRGVAVRAYHEPDVDWWIENRRKDYYSMNTIDLAALINTLRLAGHERAELVTTYGARDGYADGASPHTWSFVDDAGLVDWFLAQAGGVTR